MPVEASPAPGGSGLSLVERVEAEIRFEKETARAEMNYAPAGDPHIATRWLFGEHFALNAGCKPDPAYVQPLPSTWIGWTEQETLAWQAGWKHGAQRRNDPEAC